MSAAKSFAPLGPEGLMVVRVLEAVKEHLQGCHGRERRASGVGAPRGAPASLWEACRANDLEGLSLFRGVLVFSPLKKGRGHLSGWKRKIKLSLSSKRNAIHSLVEHLCQNDTDRLPPPIGTLSSLAPLPVASILSSIR